MVSIKELLGVTSQSCNTRERAQGSLPANRAFNSDQVISGASATARVQRASWSGPQAWRDGHCQLQASSVKLKEIQASSGKHQAPSTEVQAPSRKQQAPGSGTLEKVSSTFDQGSLL